MNDFKKYQLNRNILCIDLKAFYASVECVLRGLDPFKTPLVVADAKRGDGSIVLAVTPYLKSLGVKSRCRVFDLPKDIDIIYARPQMQTYLEYTTKIVEIYLEFISEDDLYIYSVDEAFLDVTNYLKLYNMTDYELARTILNKIYDDLKLTAACGIGPNMLLAKLSLDIEAKDNKDLIASWNYDNLKEKLHPVTPLSKMWGIGSRMERRLNLLGLMKIGDIANYDVNDLKKKFGVLGEELYYHTHGIDMSMIKDKGLLRSKPKSFGISQVLFRNYDSSEITTIILEMVDDVTSRLRLARKRAKTVALTIGYSREYESGFSRRVTLEYPTHNESIIYKTCLDLFDLYYEGYPIRTVSVSLSNFDETNIHQLSIFDDEEVEIEEEFKVKRSIDKIKNKYGKNAVLRGSSLEDHSTAKSRNKQIGGHHV